jgi:hypothetical protein
MMIRFLSKVPFVFVGRLIRLDKGMQCAFAGLWLIVVGASGIVLGINSTVELVLIRIARVEWSWAVVGDFGLLVDVTFWEMDFAIASIVDDGWLGVGVALMQVLSEELFGELFIVDFCLRQMNGDVVKVCVGVCDDGRSGQLLIVLCDVLLVLCC